MEYFSRSKPLNMIGFHRKGDGLIKKKRHTNEQMVGTLREADTSSIAAADKKHSITGQAIHRRHRLYD